ncbi:MAG: hypothetical protein AB7E55_06265 [Pigmentiphaga sp.]
MQLGKSRQGLGLEVGIGAAWGPGRFESYRGLNPDLDFVNLPSVLL